MTTSTERPDGDELLTVARAAFEWIDSIPLTVVASLPAMPGIDRDWANVVMDRAERATPTNESPAPQATKKTYIKPLRAIVEIDERYADQIRDLLNVPAPQPPVEGLREALEPWRDELTEIIGHLGAAIIQSTASDDQIIMDHVKAAHEIAKIVRRKA